MYIVATVAIIDILCFSFAFFSWKSGACWVITSIYQGKLIKLDSRVICNNWENTNKTNVLVTDERTPKNDNLPVYVLSKIFRISHF